MKKSKKNKNRDYETPIILQCPRCRKIKRWYRKFDKEGPGFCKCGSYQLWNVLKEEPKYVKGFVKVISDKGYQYLNGPHFIENPKGWTKE